MGITGGVLFFVLSYILLLYVLLLGGLLNPYCSIITLQSDPCNGHGSCYGAGQCRCQYGYGPELSFKPHSLCATENMPCTGSQLRRALAEGDSRCCSGHGNITALGCDCDYDYGPESIDNPADYDTENGMRQNLVRIFASVATPTSDALLVLMLFFLSAGGGSCREIACARRVAFHAQWGNCSVPPQSMKRWESVSGISPYITISLCNQDGHRSYR